MAEQRTWRKAKRNKAKGVYWLLVSGRDADRRFLSLGYVTEDHADLACTTLQREQDAGTASRVFELHKTDPKAAVAHLLGDLEAARLLPTPRVDYARMRLEQYVDEVYAPVRSVAKPKTWRTEEGHWKRVKAGLGSIRLQDIDARVFYRWARDMTVTKGTRDEPRTEPASGAYKRLMRSALQGCLRHAYVEGHIEELVRLGELQLEGSTKSTRDKPDPLTLEELARLMDASEPKHRAMWAVQAGQGLRPSELRRLRWEHVQWSTRTLHVAGEKTEASAAEIPLTPLAYRELQDWWLRRGQPAEGIAFPARDGQPYASVSGYKRALATAAKRANIGRLVNPYLLRDSFATIAWSLGIDKDTARRVLRHTDQTVYCRPRPADLVERVAAFDL